MWLRPDAERERIKIYGCPVSFWIFYFIADRRTRLIYLEQAAAPGNFVGFNLRAKPDIRPWVHFLGM